MLAIPGQPARLPYQAASAGMPCLPTSGKGVGIAILDSGIAYHPDLEDRVVARVSTVPGSPGATDYAGHGTHVASLAAGSGAASNGKFRGIAPEAHLIGIRVTADEDGSLSASDRYGALVAGLNWAIENREHYNIRVLNVSVGYPLIHHQHQDGSAVLLDPLGDALHRANEAGLVVVVAAGNQGSEPGSMKVTPATHPDVITVGSSDPGGTPYDPSDDRVAEFSSRGPGPGKGRPDLIAPGVDVMGANVPHSRAELQNDRALEWNYRLAQASSGDAREAQTLLRLSPEHVSDPSRARIPAKATANFLADGHPAYIALTGTSMSTPLVSGLVACLLEANPTLKPDEVKAILKDSARPLPGWDANAQGAGLLDAAAAYRMATN